jgi:hypothetical protein
MKRSLILTALLFAGLAAAAHAADGSKNNSADKQFLPPVGLDGYLQGYSLELDTSRPSLSEVPKQQGLPQSKDEVQPFIGLKLTRPLGSR